jgi:hypothetical protein
MVVLGSHPQVLGVIEDPRASRVIQNSVAGVSKKIVGEFQKKRKAAQLGFRLIMMLAQDQESTTFNLANGSVLGAWEATLSPPLFGV